MDRETSVMNPADMRSNGASTKYEAAPPTKAAAPPVPPVSAKRTVVGSDEAPYEENNDEAPDEQENGGKRKYTPSDKTKAQRQAAAKKSTGPKTPAGKATSNRNAVRHAMTAFQASILVKGEDAAAYQELHAALRREHPPLDATGDFAIGELANALWRQSRRINLAEAALIMRERQWAASADRLMARLTVPLPGEQAPLAHLLRTAVGVANLRGLIATIVDDLPSSIDEIDDQYWQACRNNAQALAQAVPELAQFVQAEPTDDALAAWRDAAAQAIMRLSAREASLRAHEEARAANATDASLVPSGHDMRLLVRYASMNDRKIRWLLDLIAEHCEQPAENDT